MVKISNNKPLKNNNSSDKDFSDIGYKTATTKCSTPFSKLNN